MGSVEDAFMEVVGGMAVGVLIVVVGGAAEVVIGVGVVVGGMVGGMVGGAVRLRVRSAQLEHGWWRESPSIATPSIATRR